MVNSVATLQVDGPARVGRYGVAELVVKVSVPKVANPFMDGKLQARFECERSGYDVNGFCDSEDGTLWRVRFCPRVPGEYRYQLRYQDLGSEAEAAGEFTCEERQEGHGFVHLDKEHPYHLVHDDGTHVFLAGKTAWRLACSPDWREFIDLAVERRMNVLRVGVEWTGWPELPGGVCWPWGGTLAAPDFTRFDLRQWQHWDKVLAYTFERGLFIEPCILTSEWFRYRPAPIPDPEMELYWDYLLARWGAYPGVLLWELYNEFTGLPDFQRYMARHFHEHDIYKRLVTTSAGPIGEEPFPEEGWNDLIVPHYCIGSWMHLDAFYRHYALHHRRHGKPVFIDETGRFGVEQHNDVAEHRRKQYWIWSISGDYCNYHSEGGCYVNLDEEPAEEYWPHMVAFFEDTEWWRMLPIHSPLPYTGTWQVKAYGLKAPDAALVYLCTMETGVEAAAAEVELTMRPGRYSVRWYKPATGECGDPTTATSDGTLSLPVPAFKDDLALRIDACDASP